MRKLVITVGLVLSMVGCTTLAKTEQVQNNTSKSVPAYAKHISHSYLEAVLTIINGDSQKRLSQAYRACVLKPYPALEAQAYALLQKNYDNKTIALIDERFLLESQKETVSDAEKALIEQKISDNNQKFAKLGTKFPALADVTFVLLDKEMAEQAGETKAFNEFHHLANERLGECVSVR